MNKEKWIADAEKMTAYFNRNMASGDVFWEYGYNISKKWLELMNKNNLSKLDVDILLGDMLNASEGQGSAYEELKILILKWIDELNI